MDLKGKYVLVAGCGVSGIAAAQLLYKVGAKPVMFDTNESLKEEDVLARFEEKCEVDFAIGKVAKDMMKQLSLVVISPGIPVDADFVEEFRQNNLPIWGEIELAYFFAKDIFGLNWHISLLKAVLRQLQVRMARQQLQHLLVKSWMITITVYLLSAILVTPIQKKPLKHRKIP